MRAASFVSSPTGQTVTIRHDTHTPGASFMPGVLLAVLKIAERLVLTIDIDALLGL
jgi:dihydrodipicolinate reductase